jgi:DNA-binding XRE family transcriptional regulator
VIVLCCCKNSVSSPRHRLEITPGQCRRDAVRIRQGDWRAVCRIDRDGDVILVEFVANRRGCLPMSDAETVTLNRAEYEALLDRLEDAEDLARLDRIEANESAQGTEANRSDYLPAELLDLLLAGEHPVRVWRRHRGLTREALAVSAGVAPSYVTEIETGKKPGSFDALAKLAAALQISLDEIAAWTTARR